MNKIVTLSLLTAVTLLAAPPIIDSGNIQKQIVDPKNIPLKEKELIKIDGISIPDVLKISDDSKKVLVKDFSIDGNSKIITSSLQEILNPYSNKELTFNEIQELVLTITNTYRNKGYFVARAYLPIQDLAKNNNVLKISIIEGKYGEFNLDNKSSVSTSQIKSILDNNKSEETININDIERSLLLINDRAGVIVSKSEITPGSAIGTSNFNIETSPAKVVDGYILADNYGSRYTGYNRLQGLININNISGIGDKISLSGLISNGTDLRNGRIGYELPIMSNGLIADFGYTRTNYDLSQEYKSSNFDGSTNIYEIGLSYPIIRSSNENLYLKGKYYKKDMKDYESESKYEDKTIDSFVTTLQYDKIYTIGNTSARLNANIDFTTGHLSSENSNPINGNYNKVDTYISNDIYFNEIFSLNSSLIVQKVLGNKNLDGSEDLTLGGPYAVKLYPYSEQSGENGYIASFELFTTLPSITSYNHKVGLFYDIADVYHEKNTDTTFERKRLKDIGVGYYADFKDFFLKTQIAWAANSEPISSEYTNHRNSKFLIQAGWVF